MSYRIESGESAHEAISRIVREQLQSALDEVADSELGLHDTIHQVRKRCKKIRGSLRLVRPDNEQLYRLENARYRDAARTISGPRDAQSRVECFTALMHRYEEQIDPESFAELRRHLISERAHDAGEGLLEERLQNVELMLQEGMTLLDEWKIQGKTPKVFRKGLRKTYGRACRTMSHAFKHPSPENFHEWRKRVKYHWYHMRLLEPLNPDDIEPRREAASELSDFLGDHHDLAVLEHHLHDNLDWFDDPRQTEVVFALIERRRRSLVQQAREAGECLFDEKPKPFGKRMLR